jgi:hypothetical protein
MLSSFVWKTTVTQGPLLPYNHRAAIFFWGREAMTMPDSDGYASFEPAETLPATSHPSRIRSIRSISAVLLFASRVSQSKRRIVTTTNIDHAVVASDTFPSSDAAPDEGEIEQSSPLARSGSGNSLGVQAAPSLNTTASHMGAEVDSMGAPGHVPPGVGSGDPSLQPLAVPRFAMMAGSAELV